MKELRASEVCLQQQLHEEKQRAQRLEPDGPLARRQEVEYRLVHAELSALDEAYGRCVRELVDSRLVLPASARMPPGPRGPLLMPPHSFAPGPSNAGSKP